MGQSLRFVVVLSAFVSLSSWAAARKAPPLPPDPLLWLEEVHGSAALAWVDRQNKHTESVIESDPLYSQLLDEFGKIYSAKDKLMNITQRGDFFYNFRQDEDHVKGVWLRCPVESFRQGKAEWETVLDVDALGAAEGVDWVWKGADTLEPDHERALIAFSRDGRDAVVVREYDLEKKGFVEGGFELPEAMSYFDWLDQDRILFGTDFGDGTMTQSGYPRILKVLKRGQKISEAQTVFSGTFKDIGVSFSRKGKKVFIIQSTDFFNNELHVMNDDLTTRATGLPTFAEIQGVFKGQLLFRISKDWKLAEQKFMSGSLLAVKIENLGKPELKPDLVYIPGEKNALRSVVITKNYVLLDVLENVRSQILRLQPSETGSWGLQKLDLPDAGNIDVMSANEENDRIIIEYESFLEPSRQIEVDVGTGEQVIVDELPSRFNESAFEMKQLFSKSHDGTRIPYFVIHKKGMELDGKNPTLLYGYGGFDVSLTPTYLGAIGKTWLERGGVYVLANIRGGGEFGPGWHQAALLENRQKAYDDFISVQQDLIRRRITSPQHLGIMGGSNGGLLMGAMLTQAPDLCNAVVCQVPLLDMLRYPLLPRGASWVAEYGDPTNAKQRKALDAYSPYHNLKPEWNYPPVFFGTSTADDRVHPGHARKMAAQMLSFGQNNVLFYENRTGGHAGAADLKSRAERDAREFVFLFKNLAPAKNCEDAAAAI